MPENAVVTNLIESIELTQAFQTNVSGDWLMEVLATIPYGAILVVIIFTLYLALTSTHQEKEK